MISPVTIANTALIGVVATGPRLLVVIGVLIFFPPFLLKALPNAGAHQKRATAGREQSTPFSMEKGSFPSSEIR
jgi:hypothetical protein